MKKIIFYAVLIIVLSQGIVFLNMIYPEGGFIAASRREELFAMVPTRSEDVGKALRAQTLPCFQEAVAEPVSPLVVEMFAEIIGGLTEIPSAKAGKVPSDEELAMHEDQTVPAMLTTFAPRIAALGGLERSTFDRTVAVLDQHGADIVHCAFDKAHAALIGQKT